MKKSLIYILGIILMVIIFGMMMLKGQSYESNSKPNTESRDIILGLKDFNYYPNTITVNSGETVRIKLDSTVSGCLRDFTIRDFGIHKYLKTPDDYVELTPTKKGTYTFACSMGMGTGVLIVK